MSKPIKFADLGRGAKVTIRGIDGATVELCVLTAFPDRKGDTLPMLVVNVLEITGDDDPFTPDAPIIMRTLKTTEMVNPGMIPQFSKRGVNFISEGCALFLREIEGGRLLLNIDSVSVHSS